MSDHPNPDLLQAFEYTLETVGPISDALTTALDAMERGERFSEATIADYRQQLEAVEQDRERLGKMLRLLWTQTKGKW